MSERVRSRWARVAHGVWAGGLVLLVAAAVLWPTLRHTALGRPLGSLYSASCHQIPERCYQAGGEPLALCARCLGVWTGLALAGLAGAAGFLDSLWGYRTALLLLALGGLDWALGGRLLPPTWLLDRTLTGLLAAAAAYWLGTRGVSAAQRALGSLGSRMSSRA